MKKLNISRIVFDTLKKRGVKITRGDEIAAISEIQRKSKLKEPKTIQYSDDNSCGCGQPSCSFGCA